MAFFSVIPVLVNQWQSILSRKPELNVTDSVSAAIASEASGDEEGTELARLNEENKILVLANKHLTDTIEALQLEVTEAGNGRECAFKQIVGLQSELLQRECELRSAEQRMEDVAVANREREQQIGELMAQHAKQVDDLVSEKDGFAQTIEHHKIEIEEHRLQYESEIVKLRTLVDTEYYARQHLTNTIEALQLEVTEACNEREHARKQILELQDEVLKRENELQCAEQYRKDVLASANRGRMDERQLMEQRTRHMDKIVSEKDAFAQRMVEQHKLEMQRQKRQHDIEMTKLHSRLEAFNVNYQELVEGRETIIRIRAYFSNLIDRRDERLRALRARIEELEELQSGKAPQQDIGEVGPNYYKLLGIERNFEHIDLHQAYRAKCRLHHPDKHCDSPDQQHHEAMFKAIKYGYEVLKYPTARELYTEWLDMGEIRLAHQNSFK